MAFALPFARPYSPNRHARPHMHRLTACRSLASPRHRRWQSSTGIVCRLRRFALGLTLAALLSILFFSREVTELFPSKTVAGSLLVDRNWSVAKSATSRFGKLQSVGQLHSSGTRPLPSSTAKNIAHSPSSSAHLSANAVVDPNGYLFFMPHSGFNNQLISFMNAAMISRLLNCTLILPPVYLGLQEMTYSPFDSLRKRLRRVDQVLLGYSSSLPAHAPHRLERKLLDRKFKAMVDLESIFNLDEMRSMGFKTISAHDIVALEHIQSAADIWRIKENIYYQFKYFDTVPGADPRFLVDNQQTKFAIEQPWLNHTFRFPPYRFVDLTNGTPALMESPVMLPERSKGIQLRYFMRKYRHFINLDASPFRRHPPKLYALGSIFGSERLTLTNPENQALFEQMWSTMAVSHPGILRVVDAIMDRIDKDGGTLIGIHVRLGDGSFVRRQSGTIQRQLDMLNSFLVNQTSLRRPVKLYMATDAPNSELLRPLRQLADAVYTLNDFMPLVDGLDVKDTLMDPRNALSSVLDLIDISNSSHRGAKSTTRKQEYRREMNALFFPVIDQMVAARAPVLIGTDASTFSSIMARMHMKHHGPKARYLGAA